MAIIYATDIHLTDKQPINRVTPVLPSSIQAFRKLITAARDGYLLLGGDLFDSPCPSYDLFNMVVKELQNKHNCYVYVIPGNHDILYGNYSSENTALSALVNMGLIQLLSDKPVMLDGYQVFGVPYQKEIYKNFKEAGLDMIGSFPQQNKIVVTHQYISDKKLPFNHISIEDFDAQDIGIVFCGHWHEAFDVKKGNTRFINSGCISKLSRNEANFKTSYVKIENAKIEHVFLEEETNIEFVQKQVSTTNFINSINDAKIEKQDIKSFINNSDETDEVKKKAIELIKEYE